MRSAAGRVTWPGLDTTSVSLISMYLALCSKYRNVNIYFVVSYDDIAAKNYSLSPGQYFDVKIEHINITHEEFKKKMRGHIDNLDNLFSEYKRLGPEIRKRLTSLKYE